MGADVVGDSVSGSKFSSVVGTSGASVVASMVGQEGDTEGMIIVGQSN